MKPLRLRRSRKRAAATLCLGLSAAAALQPSLAEPAAANSAAVYRFDIAAQPLYAALSQLAEQTGIQFVYSPDLVRSLQAPALSGSMTADQALQKLLAGSGLAHKAGQGNSVILEKRR